MRHFVYCAALAAAVFFLAGCGGNPNKKERFGDSNLRNAEFRHGGR